MLPASATLTNIVHCASARGVVIIWSIVLTCNGNLARHHWSVGISSFQARYGQTNWWQNWFSVESVYKPITTNIHHPFWSVYDSASTSWSRRTSTSWSRRASARGVVMVSQNDATRTLCGLISVAIVWVCELLACGQNIILLKSKWGCRVGRETRK